MTNALRSRRGAAAASLFALLLVAPSAALQEADAPAAEASAEPTAEEDEGPEPLPTRPPVRVQGALPLDWTDAVRWRSIGPANMGGRITDIASNPDDTNELWVATATGGVVHTTNSGTTWDHRFTDQRVSSVGAIAVAPSDPDQIWVGTGEPNPRNSVSWGDGVYVSRDHGETWRHAGLAESFQISTIVVHPEDPDVVYVGALGRLWGPNDQRGLYRTKDGGRTWERVLFVDEDTGVVEVKMHPTDPDTIVVATYERRRDMYDTNDPAVKWGDGSGIWRTTDGGDTFERLTDGLPTVELGRIGMNWSASQPDHLYAIVESSLITQEPANAAWFGISFQSADFGAGVRSVEEDSPAAKAGIEQGDVVLRIADTAVVDTNRLRRKLRDYFAGDTAKIEVLRDGEVLALDITFDSRPQDEERTDVHGRPVEGPFGIGLGGQDANVQDQQGPEGFEYGGVFKSTDRGTTWTRINSLNPRPMYYSEIRVDPSDENYVYVLGTRLHRSSDGGETFTRDGHRGDVHVDHHALWIDPNDGRHIFLGNDGGIYETRDRMENWQHHNKLALGQFYNVTVGPRDVPMIYGGLQDNGSWGGPSRTADGGPTNDDWFRVGGGDGFRCLVDPNDPDVVYYESQNGGMGRRDFADGGGSYLRPRAGRGSDMSFRFNWNTPFLLSNFNSQIYYSAGNHVFRSVQRGENQEPISPEITAGDRGAAVSLAESPRDKDVMYVGTDDGALWRTKDGGATWTDLMALNGEPAFEAEASNIAAAPRAKPAAAVAPADVPLAGEWRCKATGEGIESEEDGVFTLFLDVSETGKVSGRMESQIGDGPITRVRYKKSDGSLDFRFVGDSLTMEFDSKVDLEKGSIAGSLTAAGGAFRFDWTGTRKGSAEAAPAEALRGLGYVSSGADAPAAAQASSNDEGDDDDETEESAAESKPKKEKKFIDGTIDQLIPGRMYVGELVASRFDASRVYVAFDGHRSDDTLPWVFVSEDHGDTWESIRANLPDAVGSVRAFHEDITNEDVLYIGTEHGVYVSVDRGQSWTRFNSNLPTVPVHDFAQHAGTGELIAGTHGRSVWICDVSAFSQMSAETLEAPATLFEPADVQLLRRGRGFGSDGIQGFRGENPSRGASLHYALTERVREASLEVRDATGETVATLEGPTAKGLHRVTWNLRTGGEGRRRRFARPGVYTVRLVLDGAPVRGEVSFEVKNDPQQATTEWIAHEEAEEALQAVFEAHAEETEDQ